MELLGRSRKLLEDTISGDAQAVAKAIEEIRDSQYAPTYYNDEQALRYVIKFAYIAAIDQYLKVEELPSGKGIADVAYLPKRIWLPLLAFMGLFAAGICLLGWNEFIGLFGYGY